MHIDFCLRWRARCATFVSACFAKLLAAWFAWRDARRWLPHPSTVQRSHAGTENASTASTASSAGVFGATGATSTVTGVEAIAVFFEVFFVIVASSRGAEPEGPAPACRGHSS